MHKRHTMVMIKFDIITIYHTKNGRCRMSTTRLVRTDSGKARLLSLTVVYALRNLLVPPAIEEGEYRLLLAKFSRTQASLVAENIDVT